MKTKKHHQSTLLNRRDFFKKVGISTVLAATGSHLLSLPVLAKDIYPAGKITCYVPNAPGGGYDVISRGVAPFLGKYLKAVSPGARGGQVIIKNEPGAAGRKSFDMIYHAKPDGYTFGALDSAFATETLLTDIGFDLNKFTFLLQFNDAARILVVKKNGFANWDEMMRAAKAKELKWGVGQFGRGIHVDSIIIREAFGVPAKLIPFGGTSGVMAALFRGDVQVAAVSDDAAKPMLASGEIRVIADFSGKGGYAGVPTSKDLGRPDLAEKVSGHRFFVAPPDMPKGIRNILIAAFKQSLNDPEFQAWAKKLEIPVTPIYGDAAEKMAKRIFKFYTVDMKPLLLKNLVE